MKKRDLTKSDLKRLAAWERRVIESGAKVRVSELEDFPFKSFTEMRFAYDHGKLGFSAPYQGEFLKNVASTKHIWAHSFLSWIPILISLICVYMAWSNSNIYLLFGIIAVIIGLFVSTPFNPFRRTTLIIGLICMIVSIYFAPVSLVVISISFFGAFLSGILTRELYTMAVIEAVLYSEVVFCFMFNQHLIYIQESA